MNFLTTLSSVTKANSVVRFKLKRDHKTWFYYTASFANVHDKPNLCCDFLNEQVRWGYLLSSLLKLLKLLKLAKSTAYMFCVSAYRYVDSARAEGSVQPTPPLSRCFSRNLTPHPNSSHKEQLHRRHGIPYRQSFIKTAVNAKSKLLTSNVNRHW